MELGKFKQYSIFNTTSLCSAVVRADVNKANDPGSSHTFAEIDCQNRLIRRKVFVSAALMIRPSDLKTYPEMYSTKTL